MKSKLLKLTMILTLLISSKNLLAQNDKDSLVVVPVELIKEANIKLAERNYYKELSQKQDELIFDLQEINFYKQQTIDKLKNDNLKLTEKNQDYIDLNYSLAKNLEISKRRNIIFGTIGITSVVFAVVTAFIK